MRYRTQRLEIRPFEEKDRENMIDLFMDCVVKQTYMLPDYEHREDAAPLFLRLMEMCQDSSKYVRGIATGDGLVGFLNHTDIQGKEIELGYVIHPDFHGNGYMTEALKLATEELFAMGYDEVITGAFSTNATSIRVMEKCGMERLAKTDEIEYRGLTHTCVYYRKKQE